MRALKNVKSNLEGAHGLHLKLLGDRGHRGSSDEKEFHLTTAKSLIYQYRDCK